MTEAFPHDAAPHDYEARLAARREARSAALGEEAVRFAEMMDAREQFGPGAGEDDEEDEELTRANMVKLEARRAASKLKAANVKPVKAKGNLLNDPGNRRFPTMPETIPKTGLHIPLVGGKRLSPRRLHTPAGKLRQMRPKHEEVEVWALEQPKVKRLRNTGIAFDSQGEFYLLGTDIEGDMTVTHLADPVCLAVGPDNWRQLYNSTHATTRPYFEEETVEAWQTRLDDFVIDQTDPV